MVRNCGYEAYLENSYRANFFYNEYIESGNDWSLKPIYIGEEDMIKGIKYIKLKVKMNPTQFADPKTHDFMILIRETAIKSILPLQVGDVLAVEGEWEGRIHHDIIFSAIMV